MTLGEQAEGKAGGAVGWEARESERGDGGWQERGCGAKGYGAGGCVAPGCNNEDCSGQREEARDATGQSPRARGGEERSAAETCRTEARGCGAWVSTDGGRAGTCCAASYPGRRAES